MHDCCFEFDGLDRGKEFFVFCTVRRAHYSRFAIWMLSISMSPCSVRDLIILMD